VPEVEGEHHDQSGSGMVAKKVDKSEAINFIQANVNDTLKAKIESIKHHNDFHHHSKYLFYPDNKYKKGWELFMTLILMVSCLLTPLEIAFSRGT
jgi:hypothetical protein